MRFRQRGYRPGGGFPRRRVPSSGFATPPCCIIILFYFTLPFIWGGRSERSMDPGVQRPGLGDGIAFAKDGWLVERSFAAPGKDGEGLHRLPGCDDQELRPRPGGAGHQRQVDVLLCRRAALGLRGREWTAIACDANQPWAWRGWWAWFAIMRGRKLICFLLPSWAFPQSALPPASMHRGCPVLRHGAKPRRVVCVVQPGPPEIGLMPGQSGTTPGIRQRLPNHPQG